MSPGTGFAGPKGGRPLGGRELREANDRGAVSLPGTGFAGPKGGRPLGGRELREANDRGAQNLPAVLRLAVKPLRKPCAPR